MVRRREEARLSGTLRSAQAERADERRQEPWEKREKDGRDGEAAEKERENRRPRERWLAAGPRGTTWAERGPARGGEGKGREEVGPRAEGGKWTLPEKMKEGV